ncbi:hypothetical protein LA303_02140 [Candidatus Sulfidibacterium hydrothermale]|uniref:ApeA N-terminal domain 1-containing protein n=1 Tax=Candidatus Sulfidibacterium hydrothermale TaxID=2875962 RepID=UPI001F0A2E31|nr:HEPN domain-containing protein [Candidatus Sulfidibacterium hydrothermale]UBM62791.1 hypothetical protein LA303_02140 [Candidatus Sulfidibacterium hydrothermale]
MKVENLYTGMWWLPESQEEKYFGNLTIDVDGKANLCLFFFDPYQNIYSFYNLLSQKKQITGLVYNLSEKQDYTFQLINPIPRGMNEQGIKKYFCSSSEYIIKKGNQGFSNLMLKKIRLSTNVINEWIKPTGIKEDSLTDSFSYIPPPNIILYEDSSYKVGIEYNGKYIKDSKNSSIHIYELKWIYVELKKEISLDKVQNFIDSFEDLFTLILKNQIKFTAIELEDKNGKIYEYHSAKSKKEFSINGPISKEDIVDFNLFKNNSQSIISNWLKKREELRLIINKFLTTYKNITMYDENKFLAYISILEQYHKIRFKIFLPKGERYMRMYNKVLSELKGDSLSWVKKRLDDKSEINLRSRFRELIEKGILLCVESDLNKLIETRNFLVHFDEAKKNVFVNHELSFINIFLERSIIQMFYKELSIEN